MKLTVNFIAGNAKEKTFEDVSEVYVTAQDDEGRMYQLKATTEGLIGDLFRPPSPDSVSTFSSMWDELLPEEDEE